MKKSVKKVTPQSVKNTKQSVIVITTVDKKQAQKLHSEIEGCEVKKWTYTLQLGKCLTAHKERMNKDKTPYTEGAKNNVKKLKNGESRAYKGAWEYYVNVGLEIDLTESTANKYIKFYNDVKGEKKNLTIAEMKQFIETYKDSKSTCDASSFWSLTTINNYIKNGLQHVAKVDTSASSRPKSNTPKTASKETPKSKFEKALEIEVLNDSDNLDKILARSLRALVNRFGKDKVNAELRNMA